MLVDMILCTDAANGFGTHDGNLPWPRHKEDMCFFRDMTMDTICVVGESTRSTLPSSLPGRTLFVLSRKYNNKYEYVFKSIEKALEAARLLNKRIVIIGERVFTNNFCHQSTIISSTKYIGRDCTARTKPACFYQYRIISYSV